MMIGAVLYDLVMRLPLAVLMTYSALFTGANIHAHFAMEGPRDLHFVTAAAALISTEIYTVTVAAVTLLRLRPVGKTKGILPRITALSAGLLPATLAWLPRSPPTAAREMLGALLIVTGVVLAVYCLAFLGRSFSVMPEARRLVTSGPYSRVRHPVYLASFIQAAGFVVLYPSLLAFGLLALEVALQIVRLGYEEQVLRAAFPDYEDYSQRTPARLLPGVY
jgi:protein-S-isoprenylcysteine O-methyltransferase Ste14